MYVCIVKALSRHVRRYGQKSWFRVECIVLLLLAVSSPLAGQLGTQSAGAASSSQAIALPTSGTSQSGSVSSRQSASPGTGISTVSSSVDVTGAYSGSVPVTNIPAGPISLTLAEAVRRGLEANLGTIMANDSVRASRAQRLRQLSALLPNITANLSETVTQVNLAAYGFQFNVPPGLNFSIPSVVGPFSYSQAQGALSQSVFDLVQLRNYRASKETERASVLSAKDARELVVLAVGGTYLQVIASAAGVESQKAQVNNARAVYNQTQTRKAAGTTSKIDVTRSLVELQTQEQRLSSLEADLKKQRIVLARIIGLPLDHDLILSEALSFSETPIPEASVLIQRASQGRADLRAAEAQVRAAEIALSAARAERLPSASINGDYGVLGPNPASAHGVFSVTGSVNVPIWLGGRAKADIQEAEATLHQRQAQLADQRARVEQDVRNALIELGTIAGQVKLAQSNRDFANETLAQARDRFAAGVATTVEVVQAQEQVASAESDYISSLFSFNLAKLSLARATGDAESTLPDLLKGKHP
jgi:outer membrane protein TolC